MSSRQAPPRGVAGGLYTVAQATSSLIMSSVSGTLCRSHLLRPGTELWGSDMGSEDSSGFGSLVIS